VLFGLMLMAAPAAAQEIALTACVGDASRCFDAFTVDLGIVNSGGLMVGGGGPASAPTFNRVAITKAPDGFTPELAGFAAQGNLLPEASIEFTDATAPAGGNPPLTVALENVLVTKLRVAVDEDGSPIEQVELDYQQITLTAGQTTFCWDRVLGRRC
jgi:type VI protein secretion system component Hcp